MWLTKKKFGTPNRNLVDQIFPVTDQKFPEIGQFFFGQPKKMRKRPDNWSTKRLTKTTWTGLNKYAFCKPNVGLPYSYGGI